MLQCGSELCMFISEVTELCSLLRTQELLHIAGVSDAVYWLSAYLSGQLDMAAVAVLMTTLMKLPLFCAPALLPQSDFTLVLAIDHALCRLLRPLLPTHQLRRQNT
ncbi:hypothetical protein MRX96_038773 [Rhipicephalus microplus]